MNIDECLRQVTRVCSEYAGGVPWCVFCDSQLRPASTAETTVHKPDCPVSRLKKHIHNLQVTIRRLDGNYENKDPRCQYPYRPDTRFGYCWTYAHHVDGTLGYANLEAHCRGCEYWKPEEEKPSA